MAVVEPIEKEDKEKWEMAVNLTSWQRVPF